LIIIFCSCYAYFGFDSSFCCYENYNIEMIDLGLKLAWGLEMIYYRTHNKNKKDAQLQYKQKQAQNDRKALQENTGLPN